MVHGSGGTPQFQMHTFSCAAAHPPYFKRAFSVPFHLVLVLLFGAFPRLAVSIFTVKGLGAQISVFCDRTPAMGAEASVYAVAILRV